MNYSEPPKKQTRTRRKTNYKGSTNKKASGLTPKTDKQRDLIKALKESRQVFILGPAGTGKTYVTATYAADQYALKEIDKIIITRPHVAVGKDIGFLPGTLEEKSQPWALPVLDVLVKHLGRGAVDTGLKNGNIEIAPLALMRGRSFDNAFIIVVSKRHIKCITVEELRNGKEVTEKSKNYLGSREEFGMDKENIIQFCKFAVKFFENV